MFYFCLFRHNFCITLLESNVFYRHLENICSPLNFTDGFDRSVGKKVKGTAIIPNLVNLGKRINLWVVDDSGLSILYFFSPSFPSLKVDATELYFTIG